MKTPGCQWDTPCALGCPTCTNSYSRILPSAVRQEIKSSQLQMELLPLHLSISGISVLLTEHHSLYHFLVSLQRRRLTAHSGYSQMMKPRPGPCTLLLLLAPSEPLFKDKAISTELMHSYSRFQLLSLGWGPNENKPVCTLEVKLLLQT